MPVWFSILIAHYCTKLRFRGCTLKIKYASEEYMEKANKLSQDEIERLQSRMRGKLTRREEEKKLSLLEVLAIQLQLDDEQLAEWRERRIEINSSGQR